MALDRQTSTLPPAQPTYILRGHTAQIHSVCFIRHNTCLLTGDGDGFVVYWKLETKRALAVWKAHDASILGTAEWGDEKLITHGRDNNLRIWQLRPSDEAVLSTVLPAEDAITERPKPWLLHTLPVNTLNFCAFSKCNLHPAKHGTSQEKVASESILIAVPGRDDKKIEVYEFPDEKLRCVIPEVRTVDTGMAMAVKIVYQTSSQSHLVITGHEGGVTAVHRLPFAAGSTVVTGELIYLSQPHSQSILSLDILPDKTTYFTSSADAIIASHLIPEVPPEARLASSRSVVLASSNSHTSGLENETLQSLQVNSPNHDEAISEQTDSSPQHQIPPPTSPQPHSPTTLTFTKQTLPKSTSSSTSKPPSGLSSLLSSATSSNTTPSPRPNPNPNPRPQPAHKTIHTKHAGQQSLTVRSDGRLLATAGWDARIRIYSAKTLKEVAVLKWHKEGVYAVDFARLLDEHEHGNEDDDKGVNEDGNEVEGKEKGNERQQHQLQTQRESGLKRLQRRREEAMQKRHWVVAGAKDGKVSLWEVF